MTLRRVLPFILLNIVVSAVVVLAILAWWDGRQPEEEGVSFSPAPTLLPTQPVSAAEAQERPTATPEEESGPVVYTVQPGDTLGSISQEFDIDLDALMEANGLTDPNFLQASQQLIIPTGETDQPLEVQATPTEELAAVPSPIPTQDLSAGEAIVTLTGVTAAGSLAEEAVAIGNAGDRPVALLGWRLQNEQGLAYTFGQVTLFGEGAAIVLHTRSGQDGPSDLFWGREEAVWQTGDTITLLDAEGTVRSTLEVGNP